MLNHRFVNKRTIYFSESRDKKEVPGGILEKVRSFEIFELWDLEGPELAQGPVRNSSHSLISASTKIVLYFRIIRIERSIKKKKKKSRGSVVYVNEDEIRWTIYSV